MVLRTDHRALADTALSLRGAPDDYDELLARIGNAKTVLLGEATHGTHEFYRERARITRRLIEDKGFIAVAIEGDWPDAHRVHAYVTGRTQGTGAEALAGFRRFPAWMWRNAEVVDFLGWLRAHNDALDERRSRVGFYGLDLYSLYASIDAVLSALERLDPSAAKRARERYACFDHHGSDTRRYGYAASLGLVESCEQAVTQQLLELVERRVTPTRAAHENDNTDEDYFHAEQNARLIKNAEEYYRSMFGSSVSTWNLRDRHMLDVLEALRAHLRRRVAEPKIVVWAHNSHVGDARATAMGAQGDWTLGQLVRELAPEDTFLLGFTTYAGTVTAAGDWDAPAERKRVRPALPESHEALLHDIGQRFLLFSSDDVVRATFGEERLERAIGVVYRPRTERSSHYFEARLSQQFDALIHVDQTRALEPLESSARWRAGEVPDTYPFAV